MVEAKSAAYGRRRLASLAPVRMQLWLLPLLLFHTALSVSAQTSAPAALGTASSGLHGLVNTALPLAPTELNLSASAGYGVTEPFAPVSGLHHRVQGVFGAAISPLPWLGFALRIDGRLEMHPDDFDGSHNAGFGDPRLFARAGHALSPELALGLELGLWFPGTEAPSFVPAATSLESRALIAFTPDKSPWVVLGALGFRWDNSKHNAPDLSRLRLGDRITLGLSASNAALVAFGVAHRVGQIAELFGELSGDVLIGSDAPAFLKSPLRVALGGRYFLSPSLQAELTAITSLSQRPQVRASDPLVPIEPRFLIQVAFRYGMRLGEPPPAAHVEPLSPVAVKPDVRSASVAGSLVDEHGEPLPEAAVKLTTADGQERESITDARGHYSFADVPLGPASLEAVAIGFQTQVWDTVVQPDLPDGPARALVPQTGSGILRGLVRTFRSEPLHAQIVVNDRRGKSVANQASGDDGHFEIELPPGSYRVTISASGYKVQSRSVTIEGNAVSILNVDMRESK